MPRATPNADDLPGFLHDLAQVEHQFWSLLERGARDRRSPYHAPSVATITPDGPQVRTITLRHADRAGAIVRFNADVRGGLVGQLLADPRAMLHAYGAAERTQLRLATRALIHRDDAVSLAAWQATTASAKRCYLVPPPGSPVAAPSSGLPTALERRAPSVEESACGYALFCVVELAIEQIEWLYLHSVHKRRARFVRDAAGWRGQWLTP